MLHKIFGMLESIPRSDGPEKDKLPDLSGHRDGINTADVWTCIRPVSPAQQGSGSVRSGPVQNDMGGYRKYLARLRYFFFLS